MTAGFDEQTEALFDFDQPPPIRKGGDDYLTILASLPYCDDFYMGTWAFWALAPIDKAWQRLDLPGDIAAEHVWLVYGRKLHQALIDAHTGEILRHREYQPGKASP